MIKGRKYASETTLEFVKGEIAKKIVRRPRKDVKAKRRNGRMRIIFQGPKIVYGLGQREIQLAVATKTMSKACPRRENKKLAFYETKDSMEPTDRRVIELFTL